VVGTTLATVAGMVTRAVVLDVAAAATAVAGGRAVVVVEAGGGAVVAVVGGSVDVSGGRLVVLDTGTVDATVRSVRPDVGLVISRTPASTTSTASTVARPRTERAGGRRNTQPSPSVRGQPPETPPGL